MVSGGPFQPTLFYDSVITKLLLSDTKQATPKISLAARYNSLLHIPALKQLPELMANFISYVCQHNKLTSLSLWHTVIADPLPGDWVSFCPRLDDRGWVLAATYVY